MTDAQGITDLASGRAEVPRTDVEARIRQAWRMETIGGLAAGIAHDFNNLLVAILDYGELALERVQPKDPLYGDSAGGMCRAGTRAIREPYNPRDRRQVQVIDVHVLNGMRGTLLGKKVPPHPFQEL